MCLRGHANVCQAQVYQQANFWGCEVFLPELLQACPKRFCATFLYNLSLIKTMKTFFIGNHTKIFICYFKKCFQKEVKRYATFLPGFSTNQNVCVCVFTPALYTTEWSEREMKHCHRYLHLFSLNNMLSNLFIVHKNIKGSNASNCMVVQFQILFAIETTENFDYHHDSQVLSSFGGPIWYVFAWIKIDVWFLSAYSWPHTHSSSMHTKY